MKRLSVCVPVILLLLLNYGKCYPAISHSSMAFSFLPDSIKKHEIVITPSIGYGELPILESRISNSIFYNNEHTLTTSTEYGCSLDYLVTKNVSAGLYINSQTIPFSSLIIKQPYYYQNISNPYLYTTSPEFGISIGYLMNNSDSYRNVNVGLIVNEQTMQCKSITNQQPFYPYSIKFNCSDIGIRKLFYFQDLTANRRIQFYAGARADLSIWNETDNWNLGNNNQYEPVINTSNNLQLSLVLLGGMRYFILSAIGAQLELGYGFGAPYYAQLGIIIRLNQLRIKN